MIVLHKKELYDLFWFIYHFIVVFKNLKYIISYQIKAKQAPITPKFLKNPIDWSPTFINRSPYVGGTTIIFNKIRIIVYIINKKGPAFVPVKISKTNT